MESSIGKLLYCCISKHGRILYSYNGGDRGLETLASLCIEKTPPFHSHYFHTAAGRTFGFLIDDTVTCFAIVDHDPPNSKPPNKRKILQLLQQIKNGYKKSSSSNNNFGDDLVPVIKRLICSLESMNHSNPPTSGGYGAADVPSSTKAPLLGRSGSGERKISSSVKIDVAAEGSAGRSDGGGDSSMQQKSLSFSIRNRQVGRKLWWRHVKIVVAADLFVCLVLFGIWLAVCRGFDCVS